MYVLYIYQIYPIYAPYMYHAGNIRITWLYHACTMHVPYMFLFFSTLKSLLFAVQIRGWWIWAYWISPVSFAVRSLALNEFTTEQWSAPYEFDPAITIGDATLATFGVQTGYWWVWLGIGMLAGYAILFNVITMLAFTFLSCGSSWLCCCKSHDTSFQNHAELMLPLQLSSVDSPDES